MEFGYDVITNIAYGRDPTLDNTVEFTDEFREINGMSENTAHWKAAIILEQLRYDVKKGVSLIDEEVLRIVNG